MGENLKIRDFKELIVWQRAKELSIEIYRLTKFFPKDEQFGITSQIRRAGVSVVSNIAEGYVRQRTKEFIRFLYTALASAAELETQLMICHELGYIKSGEEYVDSKLKEIQRLLNGLINSLKRKL